MDGAVKPRWMSLARSGLPLSVRAPSTAQPLEPSPRAPVPGRRSASRRSVPSGTRGSRRAACLREAGASLRRRQAGVPSPAGGQNSAICSSLRRRDSSTRSNSSRQLRARLKAMSLMRTSESAGRHGSGSWPVARNSGGSGPLRVRSQAFTPAA